MGSFAAGSIDIERLVRLIMADLGLAGGPVSAPVPAAPGESRQDSGDVAELRLTSHVITLKAVQQAATPSVRRVVVPKGAVVTPLVYDELKDRGWDLVFDAAASSPAGRKISAAPPITRLTAAFHALSAETFPASFFDQIRKTVPVDVYRNDCVMQAAEFLAGRLADSAAKGILLTKYAAAASAVCNRKRELRAMIGRDLASLEKDAGSIGANLLILDPGAGLYQVRQMAVRFAALGAAVCPPVLQRGLEP